MLVKMDLYNFKVIDLVFAFLLTYNIRYMHLIMAKF